MSRPLRRVDAVTSIFKTQWYFLVDGDNQFLEQLVDFLEYSGGIETAKLESVGQVACSTGSDTVDSDESPKAPRYSAHISSIVISDASLSSSDSHGVTRQGVLSPCESPCVGLLQRVRTC
jgi:hypothetical protein